MIETGRWAQLNGQQEISDLEPGMDFRKAAYRRELFHRFYEFHTKYLAQPGMVYRLLPYMVTTLQLSREDALWLAFLNGNTQNPVTSYLVWREFPTFDSANRDRLEEWFSANWKRLAFDTDRRHWKTKFVESVSHYRSLIRRDWSNQTHFYNDLMWDSDTEAYNWSWTWRAVRDKFYGFGRLSAWSYLEYVRLMGYRIKPDTLMLGDIEGSKSHRNGLCKVLGRDELDWHDSNPGFDGKYDDRFLEWLASEGYELWHEAKVRAEGQPWAEHVNYFTLESTLCTFKSWFRPNRRYPMVYADMLYDRIKWAEARWPDVDFGLFWDARAYLPRDVLREHNPADVGVAPRKQNHFRLTGEPVMMDEGCGGWPCFSNGYNDWVRGQQRTLF